MISGPLQGEILRTIVRMQRPKMALEIGTFTGYGSICIAEGLAADGKLLTIEKDEELSYFHDKFFPLSPHGAKIKSIIGDSNDILPPMNEKFDFIFLDAGKKDYETHYEVLVEKMNSGAIMLADNVLWKAKVLDIEQDKMTTHLHVFNKIVSNDKRVRNVILPIRDGINLIMKH